MCHQIRSDSAVVVAVAALFILTFTCLIVSSCDNPLQPVSGEEEEQIKSELRGRSFRQFDPSVDARKRKGIILDFFESPDGIIRLWAQYSEGNVALNEWEILAKDYRIEKSGSEFRIYLNEPSAVQILPTQCDNCIQTSGLSISIRNLFDSKKIKFKLHDAGNSLPPPFPVFESWTRFKEDEFFD